MEDDGRGLNEAKILERSGSLGPFKRANRELVFMPGMTTRDSPDLLSGRGVGLDAVRKELGAAGYSVSASSAPGGGTRFEIVRGGPLAVKSV